VSRATALTLQHVAVGVVGDGEEVRRRLVASLALVQQDHVLIVDRQATVRVDGHAEQARVRLTQRIGLDLSNLVHVARTE